MKEERISQEVERRAGKENRAAWCETVHSKKQSASMILLEIYCYSLGWPSPPLLSAKMNRHQNAQRYMVI